ncbi:MAG: flagellar filament capping protein FliD [Clostridium sp.]|nr:flagellar filament capping protein FliD [Clostridium sp.]
MSSVNSIFSNDYSYLLNSSQSNRSYSTSSADTTGIIGMLGNYSSIKNGSYGKLLKAYYAQQSSEKSSKTLSEESQKAYSLVKNNASDLKNAATALSSDSLYKKGEYTVTDSKGNKTDSEYDYDTIYKNLSNFVDSYNSLLGAAASEKATATNNLALRMVATSATNVFMLDDIGVTADSDGKLSIDRDKFNQASITTIKSLFQGSGSYGDVTSSRASMMYSIATNKLGSSNTYNSGGKNSSDVLSSLYSASV